MVLKAKVSFLLNVREFDAIGHKNEHVKVVFGTSIILKLESEATMAGNFCIHVRIRSTAMKLLKVLQNNTQKLKTSVLKDSTKIFWETARGPIIFSKN